MILKARMGLLEATRCRDTEPRYPRNSKKLVSNCFKYTAVFETNECGESLGLWTTEFKHSGHEKLIFRRLKSLVCAILAVDLGDRLMW